MTNQRNRYAATLIAAALGVCGVPQAQAQSKPAAAPSSGFYVFGGFAKLFAEKNSQLTGERASPAVIVGGGYLVTPSLAVEVNLLAVGREVDTPSTAQPPAGTFQPGSLESDMATGGIAATVKYRIPVQQFVPYVGGGLGAYGTTFLTTSDSLGCTNDCNNNGPRVEKRSGDIGIHALAGLDYHVVPHHVVSGELRYLKLRADFGDIVPGKVDVGGLFLWAGYRYFF